MVSVQSQHGMVEQREHSLLWSLYDISQKEQLMLEFTAVVTDKSVLTRFLMDEPTIDVRFRFEQEHSFTKFTIIHCIVQDKDGNESLSVLHHREQALPYFFRESESASLREPCVCPP